MGQKKTLYLHIGYPKTATSYFQRGLAVNRAQLASGGWLVPDAGLSRRARDFQEPMLTHNLLAWVLQPTRQDLPKSETDGIETAWTDLRAEWDASEHSNTIVSSELMLWEVLDREQVRKAAEIMRGIPVRIVIVRRLAAEFVASIYVQAVQDWDYPGMPWEFVSDYFDNLLVFEREKWWIEAFGGEPIILDYTSFPRETMFVSSCAQLAAVPKDLWSQKMPNLRRTTLFQKNSLKRFAC